MPPCCTQLCQGNTVSRFASWSRLVDTSVCITGTIYLALAVLMLCASTPLGATLATCSDKALVTLDIGHTPLSPGALSARGQPEYGFNKALVSELARSLRSSKHIEVAILNEAGEEISLAQRAQAVHAIQRGILLSVHHDSVQEFYLESWIFEGKEQRFSNRFRGYSLFVSALNGQYEQSKNLAISLGRKLRNTGFKPTYHHAENIPGERRPIVDHATG